MSVSFILFRWYAKRIQSSPALPLMVSVRSTSNQDGPYKRGWAMWRRVQLRSRSSTCFTAAPPGMCEDAEGKVHSISPGEESEGQHSGLEATHRRLRANEHLFAFFDDIYITSKPDRVEAVLIFISLEEYLYHHARIRIHVGRHMC